MGSPVLTNAAQNLSVFGSIVYVAVDAAGLVAVDVTVPQSPQLVGTLATPNRVFDAVVNGDFVYIADLYSGLLIAPRQCDPLSGVPGNAGVSPKFSLRVLPNPSSGRTAIRPQIPVGGPVHAAICDITGRQVRDLLDGFLHLGIQDVIWDGRDDAGRSVPSGMYVVRVTSGEKSGTERLLLVR